MSHPCEPNMSVLIKLRDELCDGDETRENLKKLSAINIQIARNTKPGDTA